jgi:hypothetical protein
MNGNLKQSLWVLALGIAITGLYTPNVSAAAPARQEPGQQDRDHDRNQYQDRNYEQRGERWFFQQGVQDGQHDRQYGGNRSDHQQPSDVTDRRAYRNGYQQGFRNTAYIQRNDRRERVNYFEVGVRDGQHDRQYGGNRSDHQQPGNGNDRRVYRDGYKQGFRNAVPVRQADRTIVVNYFEEGSRDGQHDRQYGGNRNDHQRPNDANDVRAYEEGYNQGFRNAGSYQQDDRTRGINFFEQGLRDGQHDRQYGGNRNDHQQPNDANDLRAYEEGYRKGYTNSN